MAAEGIPVDVDTTKAQAFAGRLLTALNDAALCLMVSVGHRTGLFDVMTQSPPATSEDLASRAGLNERYVREWLGAMVTARVVTIDPATSRFTLPDSGQSVLSSLESHILPLVPGLTERLTQGIRVLDVGCGRGQIMNRLAEVYPRSTFMGMDLSTDAITFARAEALNKSLGNSARRRLPDAGHQRDKPHGQRYRASDWDISLRHLLHALHDRVLGTGRGGLGCHVG